MSNLAISVFYMKKYSQKSIEYQVLQNIKKDHLIEIGDVVFVALSGGADSVCLLHLLLNLKDELKIKVSACHFNHRMRGLESERDQKFVQELCQSLEVELISGQSDKKNILKSEEKAREARYLFFENILKTGRGVRVALAHNANDLAETFFLRLLRGTGIAGLRSIPPLRKKIIRPLLSVPRNEIEKYLSDNNLVFMIDKTNLESEFMRNYFRHQIWPKFQKINPNLIKTVTDEINLIENDYAFIEEETNKAFAKILISKTKNKIILDRKKWLALPLSLRGHVLRYSINQIKGLKDITYKQIEEVREILQRGTGKKYKSLPRSLRIELLSGKINIIGD